jgi:hypothetical protein
MLSPKRHDACRKLKVVWLYIVHSLLVLAKNNPPLKSTLHANGGGGGGMGNE